MFTKQQIAEMTREQVEQATQQLDKKYKLDKTIKQYTEEIDSVVNMLCDLTRRNEILNQQDGVERAAESNRANRRI